jgi:hypothetical protein
LRFITNTIFEQGGKYFVMVEVPSNEEQDLEHPTTFGTTEEAGPFDSLVGCLRRKTARLTNYRSRIQPAMDI